MSKQPQLLAWYASVIAGGHQGLVISGDGNTIALTYEPEDAPLIVQTCNVHADLVAALDRIVFLGEGTTVDELRAIARAALAKAQS